MKEITPFAISHLLTDLLGRQVNVALAPKAPEVKGKRIYGIYRSTPSKYTIVVCGDLTLFASFAGILVGLPEATAKEQALATPMSDNIRDAIHETLNILSAVLVTDERIIFQKFVLDAGLCDGTAAQALTSPDLRATFTAGITGQSSGQLTVMTRF